MVSGDDKTCVEAQEWIPGVVTCQVKTATSASSGVCLPLKESHELIASKTKHALAMRAEIPLISVKYPATLRRELIPEGSPRVYADDFKPLPNPRFNEQSGSSVEKLLLAK
jgi:D-amino peptidase